MAMSTTPATKTVMVPIRVTVLREASAGTEFVRCLGCGGALDLSQPDVELPGSFVGVCQGHCALCGSFHFINEEIGSETLVFLMPSFAELRGAVDPDKPHG